jgi:hypothetical protein
MNTYDATEIAYKNGYNQALRDFAESVKANKDYLFSSIYSKIDFEIQIDRIEKELVRRT